MNHNSNVTNLGRIASRATALLPAACTAVGGIGAVALAPAANAAIIHSSAVNLAIPLTTAGIYINVVTGVSSFSPAGSPGWDINPFSSASLSWFNPAAPTGGVYMRYPGGPTTVGNLDPGQLVDGSAVFGSGTSTASGLGAWDFNALNYFGFRFIGQDALLHYAWGSVQLGASFLDPSRTVVDLYYEDVANVGIAVGDTGSGNGIPEPSTALLLAGGFAGLMAFRRSRKRSS